MTTGWAENFPHAPDSPWLPPLPSELADDLSRLGLAGDEPTALWLRWACLHSSFVYESLPDSPLSGRTLDLLATLGKAWLRVAMIDRGRTDLGEFESNGHVSEVLQRESAARQQIGQWLADRHGARFGKGEASQLAGASRSRAREQVALQVLGALSLTTPGPGPARALLDAVGFQTLGESEGVDWPTLLAKHVNNASFSTTEAGPDHAKTFVVTVEGGGLHASATGTSIKSARKAACREYIITHRPELARPTARSVPSRPPRPYTAELPGHHRTRDWIAANMGDPDPGLICQALTHRSWTYENRALVARFDQRDYGTLATEGSEVLTTLIRHHFGLRELRRTFQAPPGALVAPAVTKQEFARLFDSMPLAEGILRSRGMTLSDEIKEDVVQAIAAAAWRTHGVRLTQHQPVPLARWINTFTPPVDSVTQLQEYCAGAKLGFEFTYEDRGEDHQREYRATIQVGVHGAPALTGEWRSGRTPAKQSAAARALDLLLGVRASAADGDDEHALVRGVFLAELREVDPERVNARREIAKGRLGVDHLVAGSYGDYLTWAAPRFELVRDSSRALLDRLGTFYSAVLREHRREAIRQWVVHNSPAQGDGTAPADRITIWRSSDAAARLALLDDLLSVSATLSDQGDAIAAFLTDQVRAVADAAGGDFEAEESIDHDQRVLTFRVPGLDLAPVLNPVVQVVDLGCAGVVAHPGDGVVSFRVPILPVTTEALGEVAMTAVRGTRSDSWLVDLRAALERFLQVTEAAIDPNQPLTTAQVENLAMAELSLMLVLRNTGAEKE